MNNEAIAEYLRQSGFLKFEVAQLSLLISNVKSEPVSRMIEERKELFINFKWTQNSDKYKDAISQIYLEKEAYIIDAQQNKHADPAKLLHHYQTFSKEESILIKKSHE
jgi:hypothetical protein